MEPRIVTLWRKSTYSGTSGDNCVESRSAGGAVEVRDTKDRAAGSVAFSPAAWRTFTNGLKTA
ncbi:MAG TPA: DUF397 domain-containing protein [Trebonia sp.]|jgi:hypothetical protein|nr:DUF397 domain-containing protein [Trebonia sp.]